MKFPAFSTSHNLPVTVASLALTTAVLVLIHLPLDIVKLHPRKRQLHDGIEDAESAAVNFTAEEVSTFDLELCGCSRSVRINAKDAVAFEDTTCGLDAFRRGSGQKVIGFSFYSNATTTSQMEKKGYVDGIAGNLNLMEKFYPGWIMRLYFDLDGEREQSATANPLLQELCTMACKSKVLDLCDSGRLPGTPTPDARPLFPMLWRFFPTLDPQVDVFLSRDLDSRFSAREVSAVAEWLEGSAEPLHSMRDHVNHNVPLLGAAWGAHLGRKNARARWARSWAKMLRDREAFEPRFKKGPDQALLARYVWTWGRRNSVQHDAYLCRQFPGSVPFPTRRLAGPNNHVASVWKDNATLLSRCPKYCRPKQHQDWLYC